MKIAYYWLTSQGHALAQQIQSVLHGDIKSKEAFQSNIQTDFKQYDALVCIMATGIVVRKIAPLLNSKATDPAVIVLDQKGQFVISLLSGHLGGANALALEIAAKIHAVPVITTATDTEQILSLDVFAKENDLKIQNLHHLKYTSSAMLDGKSILFYSDFPIENHHHLIQITNTLPAHVILSDRILDIPEHTLVLRPKSLVIGIGCKKNTDAGILESCLLDLLEQQKLSLCSVGTIATIRLKQYEPAILALCEKYQLDLKIIADEEIRRHADLFEASAFVRKVTGLPSVAEACSYLASECGETLTGKVKFQGITLAICRKELKYTL